LPFSFFIFRHIFAAAAMMHAITLLLPAAIFRLPLTPRYLIALITFAMLMPPPDYFGIAAS